MPTIQIDCTKKFYAHPDAIGFDDWCLSKGIAFECLFSEDMNDKASMSYIFQHRDHSFILQQKAFSTKMAVTYVPPSAVEMLMQNIQLIEDTLALQAKLKATGLDDKPLVMYVREVDQWLEGVYIQELRITSDRDALLKFYLSADYTCGTYKKPGSFKNAFTFDSVKKAQAYIRASGGHGDNTPCLYLKTESRLGSVIEEKYSATDVLEILSVGGGALSADAAALLGGNSNATSVDKKFLSEVREVYRGAMVGRSKAAMIHLDGFDERVFMDAESTTP